MTFWSGPTLEARLPGLIRPFQKDRIDCAAYTLSVGDQIYVTPDEDINIRRHTKQVLAMEVPFIIPPGQFAFLLTAEKIGIPRNVIAFISIKASWKVRGLINVSGFHVDPGYHGRLVFSVFNAGPQPIHLQQGIPLFLIWFADLDRDSAEFAKTKEGFTEIPSSLINGISGPIYSLQSMSKKVGKLQSSVSFIRPLVYAMIAVIATVLLTFVIPVAIDNVDTIVQFYTFSDKADGGAVIQEDASVPDESPAD